MKESETYSYHAIEFRKLSTNLLKREKNLPTTMSDLKPKKLKKCCYIQPPVRESMKLKEIYEPPAAPFDDETVYRASYMPIDAKEAEVSRGHAIKPMAEPFSDSNIKMDTNTVYKLSYQPVKAKPRIAPLKSTFEKPAIPMDLNTIYSGSYRLPGKFVECDEGAPENLIVTYAENCDDIDGLIRVHTPHEIK